MQTELELARAAMIAKRFGGNVSGASTGGEGTVRRKKKGAHKSLGGECADAAAYDLSGTSDHFDIVTRSIFAYFYFHIAFFPSYHQTIRS